MNQSVHPPQIAVVIPCYNQARFLADAIESVRGQTHAPVEIVVVDDGSEDHTRDVVATFPGVRYVRQTNQGLSGARNTGIRESRAPHLVFLDADDRLLPHALEAGLACLKANPAAAFASGHFRYVGPDGSFLVEHPPVRVDDDRYIALLRGNYIGMHATVVYRRDALQAVGGFDPEQRACEDYDLYLRIARRFPVCRHDTVVAEYRQHGANMSADTALMLDSVLAVLGRQEAYVAGDPQRQAALRAGVRAWKRHYSRPRARPNFSPGRIIRDAHEAVRNTMSNIRSGPTAGGERLLLREKIGRTRIGRVLGRVPAVRWLSRTVQRLEVSPPVGMVRFGSLRRVTPISEEFGFDRGLPIDRHYIEGFLDRNAALIRGRVLEVGDDAYTRRFGGERVSQADVLHVAEGNPLATFVGDLTSADHIPSDAFDCVVLTQTLHLIFDARAALATVYRILRPGGVLLATFPGISQIDRGEWGGTWHWSFTLASARRLFEQVFPSGSVELETHGNVLVAMGFLHGLAVEELSQEELSYTDPHYQVLITARAVKPETAA